ncbi:hypothetical protein DFJ43DRAFT_1037266 [Lentinula guzmanii]|uniref:Uncharacterized protein n=1 Tax=Lentinula guzmanii TaxID=2804957 RepID=A0AA38JPY3_9AGAR|nr:hypothetical protein DFJ43DRAFT_1037266 [Lentinula guzmanii]
MLPSLCQLWAKIHGLGTLPHALWKPIPLYKDCETRHNNVVTKLTAAQKEECAQTQEKERATRARNPSQAAELKNQPAQSAISVTLDGDQDREEVQIGGTDATAGNLRRNIEIRVDEDEALLMISDDKIEQAKGEVVEKRLLSIRGTQPTNLSAGKDYSAFSRLVKKEFDVLHVRTGAVGFRFLCPGTSDDKGFPAWFVAGNKTADFVHHHLNTTMWDLLLELELWTAKKACYGRANPIPMLCYDCFITS